MGVPHCVSLIRDFERIGTSHGHKDPNIWLILAHSKDPSFGIAFICGRSFIEVGGHGIESVTYPPAYLHLNGVHEKGELVRFAAEGSYDAREGFGEGDCLLHPAGVGHGGDVKVLRHFVCKAVAEYALRRGNESVLSALVSDSVQMRVEAMSDSERNEMVRAMYANDFVDGFEDALSVEANVRALMHRVLESESESERERLQVLGMPSGVGYLLVECRHAPMVRQRRKGGTFGTVKKVPYGVDVATLIESANVCLKRLKSGVKGIRSTL